MNKLSSAVKLEMIRRGISRHTLANMTGLSKGTISNLLSGVIRKHECILIENAMGIPIWSTPEEYERRVQLTRQLDFDPYLAGIFELRKKAGELKIHGRSKHLRKQSLIDFLAVHYLSKQHQPKHERGNKHVVFNI